VFKRTFNNIIYGIRMDIFKHKTLLLLLLSIVVVAIIGLGYLEIKSLKQKIQTIEDHLSKKSVVKPVPITEPKKPPIPKCIVCHTRDVAPSSMNKYHGKYCIECATLDFNNTRKVESFLTQSKQKDTSVKEPIQSKEPVELETTIKEEDIPEDGGKIEDEEVEVEDEEVEVEDEEVEDGEDIEEDIEEIEKTEDISSEPDVPQSMFIQTSILDTFSLPDTMIPTQSVTIEEIEDDDSNLYDKLKQVKLDPLRDLLKQHDLSYTGNKTKIIERIIHHKLDVTELLP
jgi:hypothetical protein